MANELENKIHDEILCEDVTEATVLKLYSLVEDVACRFLDSIRNYERENGEWILFDERTSKELFKEYINNTYGKQ